MSTLQMLKTFIHQKLAVAVDEILGLVETTVQNYEEEIERQKKMMESERAQNTMHNSLKIAESTRMTSISGTSLLAPQSPGTVQQELPEMHSLSSPAATEDSVEEGSFVEPVPGFQAPDAVQDSSLRDPEVHKEEVEDVEYYIVENSSQRGKRKLVDNRGYQFTVKRARGAVTDWRCCMRNRTVLCKATIVQRGETFVEGPHAHLHGAEPGLKAAAQVTAGVKHKAVQDRLKPACALVQEVLMEELEVGPCISPTKQKNLARMANRKRQQLRPAEPQDRTFQIDKNHVQDGFLKPNLWKRQEEMLPLLN